MKSELAKWTAVVIAAASISIAIWQVGEAIRDSQITRSAMEHGYIQEVVDGQVVWRKQAATLGEWVTWLIDNAKGLF